MAYQPAWRNPKNHAFDKLLDNAYSQISGAKRYIAFQQECGFSNETMRNFRYVERYSNLGMLDIAKACEVLSCTMQELLPLPTDGLKHKSLPIDSVLYSTPVVYFIQSLETTWVKIGHSISFANRQLVLKREFGDFDILLFLKGKRRDEYKYHWKFRHLHIEREWFAPEPELMNFINYCTWDELLEIVE